MSRIVEAGNVYIGDSILTWGDVWVVVNNMELAGKDRVTFFTAQGKLTYQFSEEVRCIRSGF